MLPFLAEGKFTASPWTASRTCRQQYEQQFGPGDYRPNLFVTYWAFRAMIGLLAVPALFALVGLWLTRGGRIPDQRWFAWFALLTHPDAVPGQQRGLGVHRDGPAAVGGGPQSDR